MTITTKIEKAFGADLTANPASWVYTDVSAYALGEVTVTPGRPDEASTTTPTRCTFRLKNTDGRFSPRLPSSPYYPFVRRQTPVRVSLNPGTGYVVRFQGYVDEIVPSWPSGNSDYAEVAVTASGLLRRLQQGNNVLRSALYRAVTTASVLPSAYWPCEDGADGLALSSASSPIAGVAPMLAVGASNFASTDGAPGSDKQPSFTAGGALIGTVPGSGAVTQWRVQGLWKANTGADVVPLYWATADGNFWYLDIHPGEMHFSKSIAPSVPIVSVPVDNGLWHEGRVTAVQNGGNIDLKGYFDGVQVFAESVAGNVTPVTQMQANISMLSSVLTGIGHFAAWNGTTTVAGLDTVDAMRGHAGETAGARIVRLCGEQGVPVSASSTTGTTPMGPQGIGTLLSLLRECETADGGILYDGQSAGLNYLARKDRYNLAVSMALDTKRQQVKLPFSPAEDDQRIRNDWTVTRPGGTFAHFRDPVHVAANGLYDTSATVNVQADGDLPYQAQWRVHLGTVDEMRVPGLSLQLIDRPELWASWFATMIGERITAANLPAQYPPGILDMIVEGYTETWDSSRWKVDLNTSPFRPFEVFQVQHQQLGRIGSDGVTLSIGYNATAASLVVNVVGPLISTAADTFDVDIAGERATVTAVSGTGPQTLTVTRSVNGVSKSQLSGARVNLWHSGVPGL